MGTPADYPPRTSSPFSVYSAQSNSAIPWSDGFRDKAPIFLNWRGEDIDFALQPEKDFPNTQRDTESYLSSSAMSRESMSCSSDDQVPLRHLITSDSVFDAVDSRWAAMVCINFPPDEI